jgi:hypothetical protein
VDGGGWRLARTAAASSPTETFDRSELKSVEKTSTWRVASTANNEVRRSSGRPQPEIGFRFLSEDRLTTVGRSAKTAAIDEPQQLPAHVRRALDKPGPASRKDCA